jgi:type I restriction enzyme S subunit
MNRVVIHRGIAVSCIGWQMGKAVLVDCPVATNQQINTLVPREDLANDLFVYYALTARRNEIFKLGAGGSRTPILNKTGFESICIDLPPLSEQKRIAHILGTLDDKIELNRRMNATLEGMARALFQSWFVDFDPVRAKQQGRMPAGMDAATAKLFPAEFEESDLGEIPKGWKVGTLGEVAINPRRGVDADELENTSAYIGLEHMPRRSIALADWGTAEELESNKLAFKQKEILFGKLRPYFHKVGVAPVEGVCSTDILVISTTTPDWFGFVLGHCSSDALVAHTDAMSTGTKMPRANWKDIAGYGVVLPPVKVAATFATLIEPMVARIIANIHESRTLTALRDTVLPQLLTGSITTGETSEK